MASPAPGTLSWRHCCCMVRVSGKDIYKLACRASGAGNEEPRSVRMSHPPGTFDFRAYGRLVNQASARIATDTIQMLTAAPWAQGCPSLRSTCKPVFSVPLCLCGEFSLSSAYIREHLQDIPTSANHGITVISNQ